jgi:hypothetical protein
MDMAVEFHYGHEMKFWNNSQVLGRSCEFGGVAGRRVCLLLAAALGCVFKNGYMDLD